MKMVTISNFRNKMKEYLDNIDNGFAILQKGEPVAVVLSVEEYRALMAMLSLSSDSERKKAFDRDYKDIREGKIPEGYVEV